MRYTAFVDRAVSTIQITLFFTHWPSIWNQSVLSVFGRTNYILSLNCVFPFGQSATQSCHLSSDRVQLSRIIVFGQSATQSCHCLRTVCNSVVSLSSDRVQLSRVFVFGKSTTQLYHCLWKECKSVVPLSSDRVQLKEILKGQQLPVVELPSLH